MLTLFMIAYKVSKNHIELFSTNKIYLCDEPFTYTVFNIDFFLFFNDRFLYDIYLKTFHHTSIKVV